LQSLERLQQVKIEHSMGMRLPASVLASLAKKRKNARLNVRGLQELLVRQVRLAQLAE
jgi:hypothetical protein